MSMSTPLLPTSQILKQRHLLVLQTKVDLALQDTDRPWHQRTRPGTRPVYDNLADALFRFIASRNNPGAPGGTGKAFLKSAIRYRLIVMGQ